MKHDIDDVEKIVGDELRFKIKLAIGEDAYQSLRVAKEVRKYWDLLGAIGGGGAIASSQIVATTFFAPHGLMAFLGLATAATPIGWVIAAAVLSGGAWYCVMHVYNNAKGEMVIEAPKYINTPLDFIAQSLFDLMAPLSLKVAAADGHVHDKERKCIHNYFVNEWGYDSKFVEVSCARIENKLSDYSISDVANRLAEFQKANPDCNYTAMSKDMIVFLRNILEADGLIDEGEEKAIQEVEIIFNNIGNGFAGKATEKWREADSMIENGTETIRAWLYNKSQP